MPLTLTSLEMLASFYARDFLTNSLRMFSTKSTISQIIKKTQELKISFRTLSIFGDDKKNSDVSKNIERPYLKNYKSEIDRKIDFTFVSEHCTTFNPENENRSF